MRSKGKLFWRSEWYSICSMHYEYNKDCRACNAGSWENVILTKISSFVFDHFPNLWIIWANRKYFNKHKKLIKSWFPNLNKK